MDNCNRCDELEKTVDSLEDELSQVEVERGGHLVEVRYETRAGVVKRAQSVVLPQDEAERLVAYYRNCGHEASIHRRGR